MWGVFRKIRRNPPNLRKMSYGQTDYTNAHRSHLLGFYVKATDDSPAVAQRDQYLNGPPRESYPQKTTPVHNAYVEAEMESAGMEIDQELEQAIENAPHLNRRMLRFEHHSGQVTLRGTVTSYFQKQMAQEAIRSVSGVHGIQNELEVNWPAAASAAPAI